MQQQSETHQRLHLTKAKPYAVARTRSEGQKGSRMALLHGLGCKAIGVELFRIGINIRIVMYCIDGYDYWSARFQYKG